ncbi:MAG: DUF2085 domain-containing protein [Planctomycetota bacterium]|jgi:uncharacterized membrane protein
MDGFLEEIFSHVCGRAPGHVWDPGGAGLPFCQRCTGLYVGAAVAVGLHLLLRPRPDTRFLRVHGLFLLQMGVFGFHLVPQGPFVRTLSGQLFGFGVVAFLWLLGGPEGRRPGHRAYAVTLVASLVALPAAARWGGAIAHAVLGALGAAGLAALALLAVAHALALLLHARAVPVR